MTYTNMSVRRPLDIGYEMLPEGVSALDFIQFDLVDKTKKKLYEDVPPDPLLGDKAVLRREVMEEEPIIHSRLWLKIIAKIHPDLLPSERKKIPKKREILPCHLVDEPIQPKYLSSLMPRKEVMKNPDVARYRKKNQDDISFEAMEELKYTVNWLKYVKE